MILKFFELYHRFFWSSAFLASALWTGFFYKFLGQYSISPFWWWGPAIMPFALILVMRLALWLYFLYYHKRFFTWPRVVKLMEEKEEFTLREFSKASRLPQVVAYYFLLHSPKIETVNRGMCIFKRRA